MSGIHIVFGESAYGNLHHAFKQCNEQQNTKIVRFMDGFSVGPIYNLDSVDGIQARKLWLKEVLTTISPELGDDYPDWVETQLTSINLKLNTEIKKGDTVIIWHGDNASDKIGTSFVAFLLQNKNVQFEEVDVTEYSLIKNDNKDPFTSLNTLPSELILDALQNKKSISDTKIQSLLNDWAMLSESHGLLRILVEGKVTTVSEDYYDSHILKHTSNELIKASYVVGEVMGEVDQINDTYLAYRIHQRIKQGKLQYKGHLGALWEFEIQLL